MNTGLLSALGTLTTHYKLQQTLESLPDGGNQTITDLKKRGVLLCLWVTALNDDTMPPETLSDPGELAAVCRMEEHAILARGCADKIGAALTAKYGPKQKTVQEICELALKLTTLLRRETELEQSNSTQK